MNIESEHKILKFWQRAKIFDKLRKKIQGKKRWSFLDGPITANNPMAAHHAWGRTYKDMYQRYKAMQGFDQRFQNGFDCQGLWVEVEVEKELGFKTKKDIETYGIDKFVEKCKERVRQYSVIQTAQSIRLGQWMDWGKWQTSLTDKKWQEKSHSYYTMSDENNYAIWHFLKKCRQKGYLYKGHDVVPWCLRCGTAISQHEILTEEYKEITHQAVFLKFPILENNKPSERHLLIWTTTPWTLAANVAVAVRPDFDYLQVSGVPGLGDHESLILAKNLISVLGEKKLGNDYKIIREFKGKELIGLLYTGPFDDLDVNRDLKHRVVAWDEVSETEGTGLVHIAPGCGQEDFELSKKEKLAVIDPVDEEGKYKSGFGWLSGKMVSGVAQLIFEDLKKKGMLFRVEDYKHRYPTCWRCKSELIFRLVDEWYISMDKPRKALMAAAKKIKWIPAFGLARELDWLKNMSDWLISKKRYWGLALPIFECACGHFEVIGDYEELKKRAVFGWNEFEGRSPHRPQIDKIKIKCSKCEKLVSRIPDVGNPWLDAGIVPYSTMGYFSDKNFWKKWFPADMICESFPGQFRNWFYAIIAMSAVLENKAPVKNIFGYASMVDEKGEEMHKSKGNAISFDEAAEKMGVDVMRWLYARQDPAMNLRFGWHVAEEVKKKLLIFWNLYLYFKTYVDKKNHKKLLAGEIKKIGLLDKWLISRFNNLIDLTIKKLDVYEPNVATEAIENFIINDLSTWYVRRSRNRFQKPTDKKDYVLACRVFYEVFYGLLQLLAPIIPFMTEEIYQDLKSLNMPESIHLTDYPKSDKKLINKKLESDMAEVRELVTLALAKRAEASIKIRQPLVKLFINYKNIIQNKELVELIKDEVNVKEVVLGKEVKLDTKITNELRAEGNLRELIRLIQNLRKDAGLKPGELIKLNYFNVGSLAKLIVSHSDSIKRQVSAKNIEVKKNEKEVFLAEREIEMDGEKIWVGIRRS